MVAVGTVIAIQLYLNYKNKSKKNSISSKKMGGCCGKSDERKTSEYLDGNIYSDAPKLNKTWDKNAKIVVVGAGAAGINMSVRLKENGYTNVTILEKTNRVGGKSFTIWDEFKTPHDMGM